MVGTQEARATPRISKVRLCDGGGPNGICMVVGDKLTFEVSGIAIRP